MRHIEEIVKELVKQVWPYPTAGISREFSEAWNEICKDDT